MPESIVLKVTSAFLVGGKLAKAGELVEVTTAEAKDLLARGKANLATVADEKPRVAIHTPAEPAPIEAAEPAADEAPAKPKRTKKVK